MGAPVRIGTCSWADDALVKHWYPRGLPPKERLGWYAEHFSTVEVDSTFYRVPDEAMVQNWADRTPDGFVMHIKAFGLMTRHPVRLEQLPPDLRDGMPLDARGRVDRPPREQRAVVFREFLTALEPLRQAGKLGGILFQLPPYIVPKPSSFDYLEWARDQLGGDEMLVEFRHRDWFAADRREEVLRWLEERRMSYVTVDAPRLDGGQRPRDASSRRPARLAYVRFHGRNAATWNSRGGGAAQRFDYLYDQPELAELGRAAPRARLGGRADVCVLQQQQPDRRRRPGACRRRAAPLAARGARGPAACLIGEHAAKDEPPDEQEIGALAECDEGLAGVQTLVARPDQASPYLESCPWPHGAAYRFYEEVGSSESDKETRHVDRRGLRDRARRCTDRGCASSSSHRDDGLQRHGHVHGDAPGIPTMPARARSRACKVYSGSTLVGTGNFNSADNFSFGGTLHGRCGRQLGRP